MIDGHDCSGKTTLARNLVSNCAEAVHVRPFSDELGELLWWLCLEKNYALANELALASVQKVEEEKSGRILVFDRHWVTLFTLLPEDYWTSWYPQPMTIVCWADPSVTSARMAGRGEAELYPGYNGYYCELYQQIANQFKVPLLNTSDQNEERCIELIKEMVGVL